MKRARIEVAYVAPDAQLLRALDVAPGTTVDAAVRAAGLDAVAGSSEAPVYAIHGRRVAGDTIVADGDRIDITRPLVCDPKTVRRDRARKTQK
jgi:uncharacterized protein